jgi:CRISPR/Cas system CSM-associated protein Csm3 (group 7 of RAMP superfamily)
LAKHLYDGELWEAGTEFPIRLELRLTQDDTAEDSKRLKQGLALSIRGLSTPGDIGIGARKSRGWGEFQVVGWKYRRFDLATRNGLLDWLENLAPEPLGESNDPSAFATLLEEELGVSEPLPDKRRFFQIRAEVRPVDSLLVGNIGASMEDLDVDKRHVRSRRMQTGNVVSELVPVLPGTSLAGALRARALRIVHTLAILEGEQLVEEVFGSARDGANHDSRLHVRERAILEPGPDLIQHRIAIDVFTQAPLDGALFTEHPVLTGECTSLEVLLRLREHRAKTAGLVLLLFKDLVTADLPVGGDAAVGRGRMELVPERPVAICEQDAGHRREWTLARRIGSDRLSSTTGADALEQFVRALAGSTVQ